ncbi:hypothetical protein VTK56DRAFT_2304 [Thermocarpiscus australiensis]
MTPVRPSRGARWTRNWFPIPTVSTPMTSFMLLLLHISRQFDSRSCLHRNLSCRRQLCLPACHTGKCVLWRVGCATWPALLTKPQTLSWMSWVFKCLVASSSAGRRSTECHHHTLVLGQTHTAQHSTAHPRAAHHIGYCFFELPCTTRRAAECGMARLPTWSPPAGVPHSIALNPSE